MTRKERCCKCFKTVIGLYTILNIPKREVKRKAYYCTHCELVLKDNEVCIKKITYELIK